MKTKSIIWFRNDLRLSDNKAFENAHKNKHEILFLYILDKTDPIGSASKWFLHNAIKSLQSDIKLNFKTNLIIKSGNSQEILESLAKKYKINSISWNKVFEPNALSADITISKALKDLNIETQSFNSSLLFDPETIKNLSGSYFKVFTPFWKKCLTKLNNLSSPCQIPESINAIKLDKNEEFDLDKLELLPKNPDWAKSWNNIYKISEENAHLVAQDFMENKMLNYKIGRDFPASNNTSSLSPYLHFGLISPKQLYFKSITHCDNAGLACFLSEIGWREFSYHLLYHFPQLPTQSFKPKFNNFTWENDPDLFHKWKKGMTGFPLIDAGMRQLYQTGWMHNRVRMVVASFLTKNLLIDWRWGQEWFWDCLVDADLAANSASWQWVAGSGADAAPYFRIFNPITQSQKFDPTGEYIRKWVPEISHLTNKEIHRPLKREKYPAEIIDLKLSRERALRIYKTLP